MTETNQAASPRTCGSCYACCVHLGVEELKKFPHQSCKHLDGTLGPNTRCSIYENRPLACSVYKCGWLSGLGNPVQRPDQVGFIITPYEERIPDMGYSITIMVFDVELAGSHEEGPLHETIVQLCNLDFRDIIIVFQGLENGLHFLDGNIFRCKILKAKSPKDLTVESIHPPIGKWTTQTIQ